MISGNRRGLHKRKRRVLAKPGALSIALRPAQGMAIMKNCCG